MTDPPTDATTDRATALARLYDIDLAEDPGDVNLYLALASRAGGPILELAVGTGRVAVPLAEAGYSVTGVDVDRAMLDRARARVAALGGEAVSRLVLVEADLVGLELPSAGTFSLAIIALNTLLALGSRSAQREALRTMARHLAPGGLAVVDIWLPDADDLARFDGRLILEYLREDPETGELVTKTGSAQHDAARQLVTLTSIYESGRPGQPAARWLRTDRLRLVSADELESLAEDAGLAIETIAGGYDLEPIGPASERAILVAQKPG